MNVEPEVIRDNECRVCVFPECEIFPPSGFVCIFLDRRDRVRYNVSCPAETPGEKMRGSGKVRRQDAGIPLARRKDL